jgi:CDP-diacylglycerol--glycerol-3-phosphate 3-phosphatidyltransferase
MTDGTAAADAHYEYRSEDRSLVLRWLTAPLFMPIVRRLPRGLTPNQVTLCGHACVWTSAAVALLVSDHETWVLLVLAFGYTGYNVADTIDGMYARHSGKTSRLGELLDHGLDPLGMALVALTYGIALREPAWLVLGSTAAVAYLQFLTFLHGYRVGYVVLAEVGVIEGLGLAAAVCVAAALGGLSLLTQPLVFDVSWAGLLAIAFMAAVLPALLSMRGLLRHPGDLVPLVILIAAILAWQAFGALGVRGAGLLILFVSVYEMTMITSARLRRLTLALWDAPLMAATITAAAASIALDLGTGIQGALAAALSLYALAQSARLFFRTVAATRRA